jgi:hypothetical protein
VVEGAKVAGKGRRKVAGRGFSLRELTLTLLLLGAVVVIAVRLIDLRTKLLAVEKDDPGPGGVLDVAVRALSRDLEAASRGGIPLEEAVRPVADNAGQKDWGGRLDTTGAAIAVREGTDELGLRGVIRSPLLALGPAGGPGGAGGAARIRGDSSSVVLMAKAREREGAEGLQSVIERLGSQAKRPKRLFVVTDAEGRAAVAAVRSWSLSKDAGRAVELHLDFTDPEAATRNPRGGAGAFLALGEPVTGGLFDDLVWFVARGPEGHPPDFEAAVDPPSMKFPHPYLAVAEFAGAGRWEVARVGEDVEDFQVAWGLGGPGEALTWRADVPGSLAPSAAELVDSAGSPRLRAVRLALAAKAERRWVRGDGPRPSTEVPPPLNAPGPDLARGVARVGWDPDESRRVPFERVSRDISLTLRAPR